MLAPPNLPADVQNKLTTELVKIMAMPDVTAFALKGGNDIVANTSAQFGQMMRDEKEIWLKVIREKNIKAE
jgi:tripartite-type tricarboxylate transporter receptor subunit TctC